MLQKSATLCSMTRERIPKPIAQVQRAPDATPKTRVATKPVAMARLPRTLEAKPVTPAQLELQRIQQLEVHFVRVFYDPSLINLHNVYREL